MTETTTYAYPLDVLAEAMHFIRCRHNYGRKRRKEIRIELLKRWSALEKLKKQGAEFNV